MNRKLLNVMSVVLIAAMPLLAAAQDQPRPPREPREPGPPGAPRGEFAPPEPPGAPNAPGAGMRPGGMGMGMRAPGAGGAEMMKLEMLRNYIDVVDRFARLARDPGAAGVAAVVSATDILRARGTDAAIEHFNKVLPDVKNGAVQRAIRIQLVDLYKQAGQADKALEQLDALMKDAPAAGGTTP
ncbi:tetratricopeptide repeat protein [Fontivita pretiosa]|uniref:tetratricopeptide repeat protein n=1 Tax=Fontivita pretiosa TaxID=2989684 RepID=UPI003D17C34E